MNRRRRSRAPRPPRRPGHFNRILVPLVVVLAVGVAVLVLVALTVGR